MPRDACPRVAWLSMRGRRAGETGALRPRSAVIAFCCVALAMGTGQAVAAKSVAAKSVAATSVAAAASTPAGPAGGKPPIGGPRLGSGLAVDAAPGIKPLPAKLTPKAWLVADLDTGEVLGAFDAHAKHRPASTLKTLAALALIPAVKPSTKITFTDAELGLTAQKDGRTTRVGLVPGMAYPAKRLFEAMLALSANDATEALAASAPGGRAATLASMNSIATSLQADDTHAATPDGLDGPGQQTSAYDLALVARAALATPTFTAYDTVPVVELPSTGRKLGGSNHDRLQNSYPGVIGGKDGYTTDAGQVWWGAARKNGHRLIVTEMDAGFEPVTQEIALLDWGFAVDGKITPVGTLVPPAPPAGAAIPAGGSLVRPPAASPATPHVSAARSPSGGGPSAWEWLLGALLLVVLGTLGRRHLRARPARSGAAPSMPGLSRVAPPLPGPSMPGATRTGPDLGAPSLGAPELEPSIPASSMLTPSSVAPSVPVLSSVAAAGLPATAAAPVSSVPLGTAARDAPRLKPWQAPVNDRSVVVRNPSPSRREAVASQPCAEPPAFGDPGSPHGAGRGSEPTVGPRLATASAGAVDAADRATAARLHSGAVRVIPSPGAPARPGETSGDDGR